MRSRWLVNAAGRRLARVRARLIPGRSVTFGAGWLARADPSGGPVSVHVA